MENGDVRDCQLNFFSNNIKLDLANVLLKLENFTSSNWNL